MAGYARRVLLPSQSKFRASCQSGESLTLGTKENADDRELTLDSLDADRRLFERALPGDFLEFEAELGQAQRTQVAATALEAVRGAPQGFALTLSQGILDGAQAILRVDEKGIQQYRILGLHHVLQGGQDSAVQMLVCHWHLLQAKAR